MRDNRAALLNTVYFIYFFCGLTMCFEGVFLPEFKEIFQLNYEQQMYTSFAKNVPFLLALGIGLAVKRIGYRRCMTIAMLLFGAGTLLFVPGLRMGNYSILLLGFFLVGVGFNFELVAGNPLLCALGPAETGSSRLNLGNALGAVAQILAPAMLTVLVPAAAMTAADRKPYMEGLFLFLGGVLVLVSLATFFMREVDLTGSFAVDAGQGGSSVWHSKQLWLGFLCIFLVLGVEAGQFALYRNFLEAPEIAGMSARRSQQLFTVYLALFALGRLVASRLQRRVQPVLHLKWNLAGSIVCLAIAIFARGPAALVAITANAFFVSIFFPTLYSLTIRGMGEATARASGLLTMGFTGCAVIPVLQGRLADTWSLQTSFAVGIAAYVLVIIYLHSTSPPRQAAGKAE